MGLPGFAEGLMVNAVYEAGLAWVRRLLGTNIQITSPKTDAFLENDPKQLGAGKSFKVQGRLKHLPRGHRIWLLRQNELSSKLWPQGFSAVIYDPQTKEWHGRVNGLPVSSLRIIAVVAPPTSQDFFSYWQKVGEKTNFRPIDRIPPECKNMDSVQVRVSG